ncbi:MAG: hypothetical protein KDF54_08805 [Hydrogenophaga sp.]|nr:hypothetical protein [Hydrogenophaga sp.]
MHLQYLIFDASDDGEGTGSWEAMASVRASDLPVLRAEAAHVIQVAKRQAPGPQGPLDKGGVWDADLQETIDGDRTTVTLTLIGPWAWGEALLADLGG